MSQYDAIVIGGGHNGLVCASLLAKKNKKVLLLEKNARLGGTARSEEFHPGYYSPGLLHETTNLSRRVIRELKLKKFGLRFHEKEPLTFLPEEKGQGIAFCRDTKRLSEELSEKDRAALDDYFKFFKRSSRAIRRLLESTPPHLFKFDFENLTGLLRTGLGVRLLGRSDLTEILRMAPMCVADWLNERFESKLLKAGLAGPAVYGEFAGPWSPGTATNLLFFEATAKEAVLGGPQALTICLEKAARKLGVEIKTGAAVQELNLKDQKVIGVTMADNEAYEASTVISTCDPKSTFLNLIPPRQLSHRLNYRVQNYRTRGTTAKIHLAIEGSLEWKSRPGQKFEFIRIAEEIDDIERAFDAVKYGECAKKPALEVFVPNHSQPNLAPAGHSSVSILYHFAPYYLRKGWDEKSKESLFKTALQTLKKYSPGVEKQIIGHEVFTPKDLETDYGLFEGHVFHGEHALDQYFTRPIPDCAHYESPFSGLYLGGSGSHPGGGITGRPGSLAAREVLRRLS